MSRIWAGVLTAGPCTDITSLHHSSLTDPEGQLLSLTRGSAFNRSPEDFYERGLDKSPVLLAHKAIPELVLRKLGYTIARSDATAEPVVYDVPVETRLIPEGRFEAGVCVGVRTRLEVTTAEGVVATASIEQRMFLPGDVEHMVWEVQGTPRNRVRVERLDSAEATAGNLFNRIPDIIAAPPGIVPVTELGPLMSVGGPLADERAREPPSAELSVDQLMATSREVAGVDLVDDEIVEPLTVLHRALCKERAQLDAEGARAFEQKLLRLLANRLRMTARLPAPPGDRRAADHGSGDRDGHGAIGHDEAAEGPGRIRRLQLPHVLAGLQLGVDHRRAERADRPNGSPRPSLLPLVRRTLARDEAGPLLRGARARGGGRPDRGVASSPPPSSASPRYPATGGGWASSRRPSSSSSSATP